MTKQEHKRIIKTEKLKFSLIRDWDCIFISALAILMLVGVLYSLKNEVSSGGFSLVFVVFFINLYLFWGIRERFTFSRIPINGSINYDAFLEKVELQKWDVKIKKDSFSYINTGVRPFSWGESLTLIFCHGYVLYNNCPDKGRPFYTYGDAVIKKKIIKIILETT